MNWQPHAIAQHKQPIIVASLCIFLLSGCVHSSRVQMDYISQRDDCRNVAETNQQFYTNGSQGGSAALNTKDQGAILGKIFGDCMYINGWTVATPPQQQPRPGEQQIAAKDDDLEFLSTPSRSAAPAAAQTQASAYKRQQQAQSAQQQAGQPVNNVYNPAAAAPQYVEPRRPVNTQRR